VATQRPEQVSTVTHQGAAPPLWARAGPFCWPRGQDSQGPRQTAENRPCPEHTCSDGWVCCDFAQKESVHLKAF